MHATGADSIATPIRKYCIACRVRSVVVIDLTRCAIPTTAETSFELMMVDYAS